MYFNRWKIEINPFSDAVFKTSRKVRDAKIINLQALPEKRSHSAAALSEKEYQKIFEDLSENNPYELQKNFSLSLPMNSLGEVEKEPKPHLLY